MEHNKPERNCQRNGVVWYSTSPSIHTHSGPWPDQLGIELESCFFFIIVTHTRTHRQTDGRMEEKETFFPLFLSLNRHQSQYEAEQSIGRSVCHNPHTATPVVLALLPSFFVLPVFTHDVAALLCFATSQKRRLFPNLALSSQKTTQFVTHSLSQPPLHRRLYSMRFSLLASIIPLHCAAARSVGLLACLPITTTTNKMMMTTMKKTLPSHCPLCIRTYFSMCVCGEGQRRDLPDQTGSKSTSFIRSMNFSPFPHLNRRQFARIRSF